MIVSLVVPQGMWAQTEVTESYNFYDWAVTAKTDSKPSIGQQVCKIGDNEDGAAVMAYTEKAYSLYSLDRFATSNSSKNYFLYFRYQLKNGKIQNTGLFCLAGKTAYFSILNLKDGDKIIFTTTNAPSFKSTNLSKESTPINIDDKVENNVEYTVNTTGKTNHVDLYFSAYQNITSITIKTTADEETIAAPTIKLTGVSNKDRIISITADKSNLGNTPKIYYTTNGEDPTKESAEYTEPFSISSTATIKAIAYISDNVVSEVTSQEVEAGTAITLLTPAFTQTAWNNGKATFRISDQSNILLAPAATIVCTSGNAENITSNTASLEPGTYTFHAEAEGYINSADVVLNVIADRDMTLAETLDYSAICSSYNNKVSKDGTVAYNDGKNNYYSFAYAATYDETAKDERLLTSDILQARSGYGLQNQMSGTKYIALTDIKAGQIIKFYGGCTGSNGFDIAPTETDKAITPSETIESVPAIEALQDGTIAFGIGRLSYISKIEIYNVANEVKKSIPATSHYASFSASFATAVPEGVSVYKAKAETDKVVLTKVDTEVIPANTGVILYSETEGEKTFNATTTEATADFSDNDLMATSLKANTTVPTEGNYYALFANKAAFGQLTNGMTISDNKAYLKGVEATEGNEAKTLNIVLGGETNAINNVKANATDEGVYFTIQGLKTATPTKGLYIHNGKKVIIK